jgi:hypothetical protein
MEWEPQPDEADLFCNVYIDESSQSKLRYLVIGGLVVPLSHAALLEADIIAARANTRIPFRDENGTPRVMKWEKVSGYNLDSYKIFVDTVFSFRIARNLPARKEMGVHCIAVDTSLRPLKRTGDGDREVGFEKEFYFLCAVIVPKHYRSELFCLYPDRRYARRRLRETREILNYGAFKWGDLRTWPLRRLKFADPETSQSLQAVDIFIGALAFRLNRHYEQRTLIPPRKSSATTFGESVSSAIHSTRHHSSKNDS